MSAIEFKDAGEGSFTFDPGPPDWLPQLREIAAAVGVKPRAPVSSAWFVAGYCDEMYDVGEIMLALLARLAASS